MSGGDQGRVLQNFLFPSIGIVSPPAILFGGKIKVDLEKVVSGSGCTGEWEGESHDIIQRCFAEFFESSFSDIFVNFQKSGCDLGGQGNAGQQFVAIKLSKP